MKTRIKYFLLGAITVILASCAKDVGDFTVKGESITNFDLNTPENNQSIKINTKALAESYVFSWTSAESGLGSAVNYTIIFDRAEGNFSTPIWSKASDNSGSQTRATLTYEELKQIYTLAGNTGEISLKWNVKAGNGSANVKMGKVASNLKLSLSTNGITSFTLSKPLDKSVLQLDGNYENDQLLFDWNDAVTTSGQAKYILYLDAQSGNFSNPLLTLNADEEGAASKISKTHAQWKTLFDQNKIVAGSYQWRVKALSSDLEWMSPTFNVFIEFVNWRKPIYIVGEATTVGWDINHALEMNFVTPNVWAGVYELKAGKEFKFFPEKGSWDNGIGSDRFTKFIGCSDAGGNIKNTGTVDGYYFIIVDLNTNTVTVSDSPKILGGSIAADWNTGNAVPLMRVEQGIYDTYQYITVDGYGFKFVPQTTGWDGDFGASKTKVGLLTQDGEDNLTVSQNGFYRVRLDMNTMTYSVDKTSWGIIGSATPGKWDTDTNMTMTEARGEYIWRADITLTAGEIKFRANDDWVINFGDTGSNGSLEYGGDNITVTAGNYHIELILNSATGFKYTITRN